MYSVIDGFEREFLYSDAKVLQVEKKLYHGRNRELVNKLKQHILREAVSNFQIENFESVFEHVKKII